MSSTGNGSAGAALQAPLEPRHSGPQQPVWPNFRVAAPKTGFPDAGVTGVVRVVAELPRSHTFLGIPPYNVLQDVLPMFSSHRVAEPYIVAGPIYIASQRATVPESNGRLAHVLKRCSSRLP